MELKGLLSISGKPGLYKHISQTKNGIIVESLVDKKRMPAYASAKISALEDIAIYTEDEDMPLVDVFKRIYESEEGKTALDKKASNEELKTYFDEVLPEYDKERVYVSDIKKILSWYNLLVELDMMDFTEKPDSGEASSEKKESDSATTSTNKEEAKTEKKETKKTKPVGKQEAKTKAKTAPKKTAAKTTSAKKK